MVASMGSLIFACLGFAIHMVLEKKVPEFLEFLESILSGISTARVGKGEYGQAGNDEFKLSRMEEGAGAGSSGDDYGGSVPEMAPTLKDGKFGDHIIVNNIAIKNEPKLMAEAIRTIMSQDDDSVPHTPPQNAPKK